MRPGTLTPHPDSVGVFSVICCAALNGIYGVVERGRNGLTPALFNIAANSRNELKLPVSALRKFRSDAPKAVIRKPRDVSKGAGNRELTHFLFSFATDAQAIVHGAMSSFHANFRCGFDSHGIDLDRSYATLFFAINYQNQMQHRLLQIIPAVSSVLSVALAPRAVWGADRIAVA
jgi:hypothetical protein